MTTVSAAPVPASGMALKDSLRPVPRPGRRYRLLAAGVALLAVASAAVGIAVGSGDEEPASTVPEAKRGEPTERISFLARLIPPAPERTRRAPAGVPRSVAELGRRLPLERKVAQVFLLGFRGTDLMAEIFQRLRRQDIGGILIDRPNYTGAATLGQLAGEAIVVSRQARRVPPWVMAEQEGGEANVFPDLPPAGAPADIPSAEDAAAEAGRSAAALRRLNITGVLAPVIDVGPEAAPALGGRIYSDDPREVADFARATVLAYRRGRMFSAVKHFPGLGSGSVPTEEGPSQVGLTTEELRRRDLVPFRAAFRAGAPAVVLSHALYDTDDFTVPGSLSRKIIGGLLRREMRFRGVAITDDLADPPITAISSVGDAAVQALRAGADMLFISGPASDQRIAYVSVLRAVRRRRIPRARLEEAVARILAAKRRYGLIR
jgi:beta-N-acetylhexosaminidase